jgi:cold shock CspA family protein
MSGSKITFGKKEREKKKLKKRQDKEGKKEERKANSNKGKALEDMIAYVDEYGNLSDTPPVPMAERKPSRVQDYSQSELGDEKEAPTLSMREGVVNFFNEQKGYGFITDKKTKKSIFVHIHALKEPVIQGDRVQFNVESNQKGLNAINVKKLA